MGRGSRDSESSEARELELFLKGLCEVGFGNLPYDVLCSFRESVRQRFGYIPLPEDEKWEDVLNFAEEVFVGD